MVSICPAPQNKPDAHWLTSAVKNERLQSLLDEESEKLARQNAEYEQLRSSAVGLIPSRKTVSDHSNSPH
jgi:hypothetical protein